MKYQLILGFAVLLVVGVFCEEETKDADTCQPGEDYQVGCNTCKCPENGKKAESACTLKACPEESEAPGSSTDSDAQVTDKCEPGTTFKKDDCNTCTCPENGSKAEAACTAIAC